MSIRFDRLKVLADHLMKGKLGHGAFFFGAWHADAEEAIREGLDISLPEGFCGTLGCAIGEAPFAHNRDWELRLTSWGVAPCLIQGSEENPEDDARAFYGLNEAEFQHLFIPSDVAYCFQAPKRYGGNRLRDSATKEEVAANIYAFIEKMQPEQAQ